MPNFFAHCDNLMVIIIKQKYKFVNRNISKSINSETSYKTKTSISKTEEAKKIIVKNKEYVEDLKQGFSSIKRSFEELSMLIAKHR